MSMSRLTPTDATARLEHRSADATNRAMPDGTRRPPAARGHQPPPTVEIMR
jgi:hypothetical protein